MGNTIQLVLLILLCGVVIAGILVVWHDMELEVERRKHRRFETMDQQKYKQDMLTLRRASKADRNKETQ